MLHTREDGLKIPHTSQGFHPSQLHLLLDPLNSAVEVEQRFEKVHCESNIRVYQAIHLSILFQHTRSYNQPIFRQVLH